MKKRGSFETKLRLFSIILILVVYMYKEIKIQSKIDNLRIVEKAIDEILGDLGLAKEAYGKIMVCSMEAVNNAVVHGNKGIEERFVIVNMVLTKSEFVISVEDEGDGFIPDLIPDPTEPENIENLRGRGVFLMKHLADEIVFNDKGNLVRMTFKDISS